MQVAGSASLHIFLRKEPGFRNQVLQGFKKFAVEVGDVVKEMDDHMPEAFLGDHVFLAADVAESTLDNGTAIEAIFFFSLRNMRHLPIFSKNKYKKIHAIVFFCVTVYKSGIFEVEKTLSFHMKNTLLLSLLLACVPVVVSNKTDFQAI